jgi:hypothetical protein
MRVLLLVVTLVALSGHAHAAKHEATVWNTLARLSDGSQRKIVFLGETTPDTMLPLSRCAVGVWKLSKETATHFVGTLSTPTFNYPRAAKSLSIKIRKTRELMGMHRDYRTALHAIVRGSGQLVVREVKGGQWEVVGFATESVGKLFANNAHWVADPKRPPKPAAPKPIIDSKADAAALVKLINDYRVSLKLPRLQVSPALTKVAQAHVHDLNVNKPVKKGCNMHSWSSEGSWSPCCYDSSKAAARCMWVKPKEIAGYAGKGYEIAANASGLTPERALELWQKSQAHHEVMINRGIWTKPWRAMGVAIDGDYGVAWFADE